MCICAAVWAAGGELLWGRTQLQSNAEQSPVTPMACQALEKGITALFSVCDLFNVTTSAAKRSRKLAIWEKGHLIHQ